MKKEELVALGISEETAAKVLEINGKDIEHAKGVVTTAKDKTIADLTTERDDLKTRLTTAETTLKGFEGIDPQKIQQEVQDYKKRAEDAEAEFAKKMTARDQKDWIKTKLDEYGVASPYARKQLEAECMSAESGLTWKDGAFFGFDDFMKKAKEADKSLYLTAEEKAASEKEAELQGKAPKFTGPTDGGDGPGDKKYVPPVIF